MQFSKRHTTHRYAAVERQAELIEKMLTAADVEFSRGDSPISASRYIEVFEGEEHLLTIRISDHDEPESAAAYKGEERRCYVWDDDTPTEAAAKVCRALGIDAPKGFRPEDFAARSQAAKKAAATRRTARTKELSERVAAILPELRATKTGGSGYAARIARARYPDAPKRQISDIAWAASRIVVAEKALERAGEDQDKLTEIIKQGPDRARDEARQRLQRLIGAERFGALRPAGLPRPQWHG